MLALDKAHAPGPSSRRLAATPREGPQQGEGSLICVRSYPRRGFSIDDQENVLDLEPGFDVDRRLVIAVAVALDALQDR